MHILMSKFNFLRIIGNSLFRDTFFLLLTQIAKYILPLTTIPYLARILGPEVWGLILFTQSFSQWLQILLEYGFGLSATRDISRHRDNKDEIADVVAGVLSATCLLIATSFFLSITLGLSIPILSKHWNYTILAWMLAVFQSISPFWYFQGTERLQIPATLDIVVRLVSTIATFMFVQNGDDAWKILVFQGASSLIVSVVLICWMYKEIPWRSPRIYLAISGLKSGFSIFIFRGSVSLYTVANTLILGFLMPASMIAFFAGAEKISKSLFGLLVPMSQAVFPRISYLLTNNVNSALRLLKISLFVMVGTSILLMLFLIWTAPILVHFILGDQFKPAIPLIRILSLLLPLIALSTVLGVQWMLPLGFDRAFSLITISAGFVNISLGLLLTRWFGLQGMAWAVVFSELFVTVGVTSVLLKNNFGLKKPLANL